MNRKLTPRNLAAGGLLVGVVSSALFAGGLLEPVELKLYDERLRASAEGAVNGSLVIVNIPERPQARQITRLLRRLRAEGAEGFVLQPRVRGTSGEIRDLAEEAAKHRSAVLGYEFASADIRLMLDGKPPRQGPRIDPRLLRVATSIGYQTRLPGPDGILRRFTPVAGPESIEIGLAAAEAVDPTVRLPRPAPMLGEQRLMGPGPRLLIRYESGPEASVSVSPGDVIARKGPPFEGKIALLGPVGPAARRWATPFGLLSDIEVTAQIAGSLLAGRGITRAPVWLVVAAIVVVALALPVGAPQRRPVFEVLYALAVGSLIWLFAGVAFGSGVWIDVVPLGAVLAGHLGVQAVLRTASLTSARPERVAGPRGPFFSALGELLLHGAFAHAVRIWIDEEDGTPRTVHLRGDVPSGLVLGMHGHMASEVSRDEGQIVYVPLVGAGRVLGGAALIRRRSRELAPGRLTLLNQVASAFADQWSSEAGSKTGPSTEGPLTRVAGRLSALDHFPAERAARLADLAARIGKAGNLDEPEVTILRRAASCHDLGKIGVPSAVLDSVERLSDQEFEIVKQHSSVAGRILRAAGAHPDMIRISEEHHERWDGRGYPNGLSGTSIHTGARILAVADSIISMTCERPYRGRLPAEAVIEELRRQKSKMFDPVIVEAALKVAQENPELLGREKVSPSPAEH